MPTIMIVLNILFAIGVVMVVAGGLLVAIATQHRDHGVLATGPVLRRRLWSPGARTPRPWVRGSHVVVKSGPRRKRRTPSQSS